MVLYITILSLVYASAFPTHIPPPPVANRTQPCRFLVASLFLNESWFDESSYCYSSPATRFAISSKCRDDQAKGWEINGGEPSRRNTAVGIEGCSAAVVQHLEQSVKSCRSALKHMKPTHGK